MLSRSLNEYPAAEAVVHRNVEQKEVVNETATSDKENNDNIQPPEMIIGSVGKKSSLHIRNLSPVDIVALSPDEVRQQPVSSFDQGFKVPNLILSNKTKKCLRRSLFKPESSAPICSTPMSSYRHKSGSMMFFSENEASGRVNLSPIKAAEALKTKGSSGSDDAMIQPQASSSKNVISPVKISQVQSIVSIEDDLRNQYEPHRKSHLSVENNNKQVYTTQAGLSRKATPIKTPVVLLQHMEIDDNLIEHYRQERFCVQNQTDMNSIKMVETPTISRNLRSGVLNSQLALKLRQCDDSSDESQNVEADINHDATEDSDLTDDEQPLAKSTLKPPSSFGNKTSSAAIIPAIAQGTLETENENAIALPILDTVNEEQPQKSNSKISRSQPDVFPKPATEQEMHQTQSEMDTSLAKVISSELIRSFRSLSKRRNEDVGPTLVERESLRIIAPAKKRKVSTVKAKSAPRPKKKRSTSTNKKRTLYSQDENDILPTENEREASPALPADVLEAGDVTETEIIPKKAGRSKNQTKRKAEMRPNIIENLGEDQNSGSNLPRYKLRVRRYPKPYWLNNNDANSYMISYGNISVKQFIADKMLKTRMKKDGISKKQFPPSDISSMIQPTEKLKIYEKMKSNIKQDNRLLKLASSKHHQMKGTKSQSCQGTIDKKSTAATTVASSALSNRIGDSFASLIQSLCDGQMSSSSTTSMSVQRVGFGE